MIFNKILFAALTLSFIFSGCTEFLKGKPAKEAAIEIKPEAMSCLKDVSLEMKKFLNSESTNENIEKSFNCIDSTLKEFQTHVEGKEAADAFNADELSQIFNKFLKDSKISKAAVLDMLALKAAMLGGSDQRITKAEILTLRDFLMAAKTEVKNLLPYAQLFKFAKDDKPFPKSMIKSGFAQLNLSLKTLLKVSKLTRSNYTYVDFKNMLLNLKLIDQEQAGILALADKVNDLIIGGVTINNDADGEMYLDNLTEVLRLYSTQIQGYVKFEISSPAVIDDTLEYITDVVALLENSIQFKKTSLISTESLDPVIAEIERKEILPIKLSVETALSFYKTLLVRVFESGLNSDIKAFKGIEHIHFVNIKREIAVYRLFSRLFEKIADPTQVARLSLKTVQTEIKQFNVAENQDILGAFDQETQEQILRIAEELKMEMSRPTPTIYRSNKIILAVNQEIWEQGWSDLARSFYMMMLSRQLVIGWGTAPRAKEMKNAFIDEQGIVQWYSEFKAFGIETKSFDPRNANAGLSTLRAANLFTRAGNGDSKMNFRETTEQLGILISGGGQTAREMNEGFEKANCNLPETDVYNFNWKNEACVKQDLHKNYKYYFSNLSYLVSYINRMNDDQFEDFYAAIMDIARTDLKNKDTRLETSDIRMMTILFHYIESLFATYDQNRNLTLSAKEIQEAYPKFKVFAEDYAHKNAQASLDTFNKWLGSKTGYGCFNEADLIKDGFVYLVLNSKNAGMSNLNIAPCFRDDVPLMDLDGEVDRRGVINTFKILKAVLGS